MRSRRFAVAAVGTAVIAVVLSGCSLLPQFGVPGSSAPQVGECWNASLAQADAWAEWKGAGATSCSSKHVLYTYGVGELKGESASDWTAKGSTTALSNAISNAASDSCNASYSKFLPGITAAEQLVQSFFFVPTQAQWKSGARWVRCDIGVIATGTSVDHRKLGGLPATISTFTGLVAADPTRFDYCVNGPDSVEKSGPLDSSASIVADCTKDPEWALVSFADFPGGSSAAYPSSASVKTVTTEACSDDVQAEGEVWTAYIPTRAEWKTGDREIDCWIGTDSAGGGPATA